ncbi:VOC family protein [Mucilaginibacter terrae]|uniref:3-demethylubiquinone-9 3-methyltransferase (Glyoxalase superfamily) n=1 Tax=Mucilaginibacter terrae TaxID=1955052 RepID=A0ABU3H1N9_9SPHI|nr:VOC family protein [Mucilaginibacter terrae]MDT3405621.1 putative 3-demethylubiquinone-9 3-methyltransferase (glyoxalase superfamily) [Mucilaginibacter terrae]
MHPLTTFLWFNTEAEEAANFYVSIFKDAEIKKVTRTPEGIPGLEGGAVLTVEFTLNGTHFVTLNGNTQYKSTPSVSFVVNCDTQEEVDHYWDNLLEGGQSMACGWLTDKYSISWQITPTILPKLISDPNQKKANAAMQAMMKMIKLDIPSLQKAYDEA